MMKFRNRNLFEVVPANIAIIENDSLIHCNMFKNDNTKFILKDVANKNDLKNVQYLLAPKKGTIITKDEMSQYLVDFYLRLNAALKGGKVDESNIYDFIYDFVNSNEQLQQDEEIPDDVEPAIFGELKNEGVVGELKQQLGQWGIKGEAKIQKPAPIMMKHDIPLDNEGVWKQKPQIPLLAEAKLHVLCPHPEHGLSIHLEGVDFIFINNVGWRRLPK